MPFSSVLARLLGRHVEALLALVIVAAVAACGGSPDGGFGPEEAVELWVQPDSVGIPVYMPLDLDLASRHVVWDLDRIIRGVLRYDASAGVFGAFGLWDRPPAEVVNPLRLAVSVEHGIFVYDDSTGLVDLFTPDGQHIRGFDPGFRPVIFEVARQPLRLTLGVESGPDSLPHLTVIQTDFRGQNPDTLLSPRHGPEVLHTVAAEGGSMVVTPSTAGLWLYARQVPDTVFELASEGHGRKLVLPEADARRVGVAADVEQKIVCTVAPSTEGGLDYEAYDVSESAPGDVIDGGAIYLGARTTPVDFQPKVAYDGVVAGWVRSPRSPFLPKAFDMRLADLRAGAEAARAGRAARRAAIDAEWQRLTEEAATRQAAKEAEALPTDETSEEAAVERDGVEAPVE